MEDLFDPAGRFSPGMTKDIVKNIIEFIEKKQPIDSLLILLELDTELSDGVTNEYPKIRDSLNKWNIFTPNITLNLFLQLYTITSQVFDRHLFIWLCEKDNEHDIRIIYTGCMYLCFSDFVWVYKLYNLEGFIDTRFDPDSIHTIIETGNIDILTFLVQNEKTNLNLINTDDLEKLYRLNKYNMFTHLILKLSADAKKYILKALIDNNFDMFYTLYQNCFAQSIHLSNLLKEIFVDTLGRDVRERFKLFKKQVQDRIKVSKSFIQAIKQEDENKINEYILTADINYYKSGTNPIIMGCEVGNTMITKQLLAKGASIYSEDRNKYSLLNLASLRGYLEVVKLLLDWGANIHHKTEFNSSSIILASMCGHIRVVELLIKLGANIHDSNNNNFSSIIFASKNGYLNLTKLLINHGANVHDKTDSGDSSIILASEYGHLDVVDYLISVGADFDDKNNRGYNSLFLAYRNNKLDVVKLLIKKGANIHERFDNSGNNLIMYSCLDGNSEIAELLLNKGTSVHYTDIDNNTPIILASTRGHLNTVKMLLNHGANIHWTNIYGNNSLILASKNCHGNTVKFLINNGSDIHHKNNAGRSPLISVCTNHTWVRKPSDLTIIDFLLSKGANIHEKDNENMTSIMHACAGDLLDVVDLLLCKGANLNDKIVIPGNQNLIIDCFSIVQNNQYYHDNKIKMLSHLVKWPTTMFIHVFKELSLYYIIDAESIIDFFQYVGIEGFT
jgi:ankyrin repeat protein